MLFVPMADGQNDGMSKNKKETAVILLVEQKTSGFVVLSTPPNRATNTENAGKGRKS